ncbi:MAG TPA: RiPP maturation radical SAM C-methyltransferase [Elusimicrobiota bacterium]|nr:RiPP maturation radical SAM C-methyltransferase [Elusimicrobiota bacterium]
MTAPRVALVSAPWNCTNGFLDQTPALLKGLLARRGLSANIHPLNLEFIESAGCHLYVALIRWKFSDLVFSGRKIPADDPELRASLENIFAEFPDVSAEKIAELMEETVPAFLAEVPALADWSLYRLIALHAQKDLMSSLRIAEVLKSANPAGRIFLSGERGQGECGREILAACPWIDYVADGEPEKILPDLAARVVAGQSAEDVRGLLYRGNGGVRTTGRAERLDPNELPPPDYDDFFRRLKRSPVLRRLQRVLPLETSRGCWWAEKHPCFFCGFHPDEETARFLSKKPDRLLEEITHLAERYEELEFQLQDKTLDLDFFKELLPRLKNGDNDFSFSGILRPNVTREQLGLLKEAGFQTIYWGLESLSTELLKRAGKGTTAGQNVRLLKWCRELDITAFWNFLYGFPGESPDTYAQLLKRLPALSHLPAPSFIQRLELRRGSPHRADPGAFGFADVKPSLLETLIWRPPLFHPEKMAMFFDYSYAEQRGDPDFYVAPLRDFWKRWKTAYREKKTYLFYERGVDFIRFYDNRLTLTGHPNEYLSRVFEYGQLHKAIYLFCENDLREPREILRHIRSLWPDSPDSDILSALHELGQAGLLFEDAGRCVGLALPRASLSRPLIQQAHKNLLKTSVISPALLEDPL